MTKIVVVGGGPGGYVAAIRAAQLGAEVTLVEKDALGGTCLNRGCIPTKALLHTAELYHDAQNGESCGVVAREVTLDFAKAQARKDALVDQLVGGVNGLMKANKINVVRGSASFAPGGALTVDGKDMPFDKLILATGSVPAMPNIPGIDGCLDSTGALSLDLVPDSMAVIGGGVVGVEMATIYSALGSRVTIIEAQSEILPMMDLELAKIIRAELEKRGVTVLTGATALAIEDDPACVRVMHNGAVVTVDAEKTLVSVGRRADTQSLCLNNAGIRHDGGRILVDEHQRTNFPNIYAIGDCTGGVMLAHVASAQGEVAAENAMGHHALYCGKTNPSCVYTNPEFAGVGLTEEEATSQNLDYIIGRFPLMANGKALITGGLGVVKIIAGKKYGEILGVHIVGPRATDLIAQAALSIGVEMTLDEVIATIYAHPTISEAVREAAMAAQGRAIHIPNRGK